MDLLTPTHPRWNEFVSVLGFLVRTNGCDGDRAHPHAKAAMTNMGNVDIEASLDYFQHHGGHCDCEILFNVEARRDAS